MSSAKMITMLGRFDSLGAAETPFCAANDARTNQPAKANNVVLMVFSQTAGGRRQCNALMHLVSQKNHFAVYLSGIYQDDGRRDDFLEAYKDTGKRLDVGQSCVRFRKIEDVPFEVIGDAIASVPMDEFIAVAKKARER